MWGILMKAIQPCMILWKSMHPFRSFIRAFDHWLSGLSRVQEFTTAADVVLRIQEATAPVELHLPGRVIPAGAKVLMLHLWNDRMPAIPEKGPDLAWALQLRRLVESSSRAVASHIQATPALHEMQAVGGITAHVSFQGVNGGRAMLERLGFHILPYHRPLGAFGEIWENLFAYGLMWAYNPGSLRHHRLLDLRRTEFWMPMDQFLSRFGNPPR